MTLDWCIFSLMLLQPRVISVLSYYLTSLVTSVSTALNKFLTGSGFHCLFAFSSGFLLIGSDPLLSLTNGFPWLAAGLRHEYRFGFFSAYNLILILLFGICGSDFCFQMGGYVFDRLGFVISTQSLQIGKNPFSRFVRNSGVLLHFRTSSETVLCNFCPAAQFYERICF